MSIWLQFFGEQKLSNKIDSLEKHIVQALDTATFDFVFLKDYLNEVKFTSHFMKGKELKDGYFIYNSKNWIITKNKDSISGNYIKLSYPFYKDKIHGGISVIIQENLITIIGDMEHFSDFGLMQNEEIAFGYLRFVEKMTNLFKGTKVILCSEQLMNTEERSLSFEKIEKEIIESKAIKVSNIMEIKIDNYYIHQIK